MGSASTPNRYQSRTSPEKLRGAYYTPADLVDRIFAELQPREGDLILDPACGDGRFLRGAVAAAARACPGEDPGQIAARWLPRLIGIDLDERTAAAARSTVLAACRDTLGIHADETMPRVLPLDPLEQPDLETLLRLAGAAPPGPGGRLLVVGNPPYVEAKRLGRGDKQRLERLHPGALTGAPDLYLYFLHVCLNWLRPGDELALVLPNKLLINANGRDLRERLLGLANGSGRLRQIWFATRMNLFPGASVYPIVLFARRGPERAAPAGRFPVRFLERAGAGTLRLGAARHIPARWYRATTTRAFFPPPATPRLCGALDRLLELPAGRRLADVLDIRWSVSFHRAGLRERFVSRSRPTSPHARPFLGGGAFAGNGEVARYRLEWRGWWIDYDREQLQELGNSLPDPAIFTAPKVVICQNSRTLRAACDDAGYALKDTFLCGVLRPVDHPLVRHPRALVALLCSRAIHFYVAHVFFGGHVGNGYLHFLRSFLADLPLGEWDSERARQAADLVRAREQVDPAGAEAIEASLEGLVTGALGLSAAEEQAIADWAGADRNWRDRERIRRS